MGIDVADNASPTILNNIFANLTTSISTLNNRNNPTPVAVVIGANLFQNAPSVGSNAISLTPNDPLFVNPLKGNFYLASGSKAIDSSLNLLQDRPNLVSVTTPLGIAPSDVTAPARDVFGQLRVDDPTQNPPPGLGANIFKDRGAIDRADLLAPFAILVDPEDNDAEGRDKDPNVTVVRLQDGTVSAFEIKLQDGIGADSVFEGTGLDASTVTAESIRVLRNGELLEPGVDYTFGYQKSNGTLRLTPSSGIWEPNSAYQIFLNNRSRTIVSTAAGNRVVDGSQFTIGDSFGKVATFEYESGYTLQVPRTLTLEVPDLIANPGAITDGQTFVVRDGSQSVTFEFDQNNNAGANSVVIPFTASSTRDQIADAIRIALNGAGLGLMPRNLGNGLVHMGSLANHSVDASGSKLRLFGVASGVADGGTFKITYGDTVVTFEFDSNNLKSAANQRISFTAADTHVEIAAKIAAAINVANATFAPALALNPVDLGDGRVQLEGASTYQVNTNGTTLTHALSTSGREAWVLKVPALGGSAVTDGQTFTIQFGQKTPVRFEFDTDGSVASGNLAISFRGSSTPPASTQAELVAAIISRVASAGLGLAPVDLGNGDIRLGAVQSHELDTSSANLSQLGLPGVSHSLRMEVPAAGGVVVLDGQSFQITSGTNSVRFEFDTNGSFSAGSVGVAITAASTQDAIAVALVNVIKNAGLGLTPLNLGGGRVELQETIAVKLDTAGSVLAQSGVAGGAIPMATPRSTRTLFLDGATSIAGITNSVLPAIRDIAGNRLRGNQPSGETVFTILLPTVELDYGDAPDNGALGSYPTLLAHNGARHVLLAGSTLFMGTGVDAEADGQPTITAAGDDGNQTDDEEGVVLNGIFTPGFPTPLTIVAGDGGFVDAWLDMNQDGDWDDFGEKILDSAPVSVGINRLVTSIVPVNALLGNTFARYRISRTGGVFPTGVVVDGEAEDHAAKVLSNVKPVAALSPIPLAARDEDDPAFQLNLENVGGQRAFTDADISNGNNDFLTYSISLNPRESQNPALVGLSISGSVITITPLLNQNGSAVVDVTATDHGGQTATTKLTVVLNAVNDAPVLSIPLDASGMPATLTTTEDTSRSLTGITVADVDLGSTDVVDVRMVTANIGSRITVATSINGVPQPVTLSGNGTNSVTITATPTVINALFGATSGVVYRPAPEFSGTSDNVAITVDDRGQRPGPALTATKVIPVSVAAVNDAPTMTIVGPQQIPEDTDLALNGFVITDPDAGTGSLDVFINVTDGIVRLNGGNAVVPGSLVIAGADQSSSVTLRGTVNQLNAVVNGMVFRGTQNFNGFASLTVTVNDRGNSPAPARQTTQVIDIQVLAVNDAPSFTITQPMLPAVNEDAPLQTVSLISLANVTRGPADEAGQTVTFQMTRVVGAGDLAFSVSPTINPSTGNLSYTPAPNANGQAVFDVTLIDNGGVANGGVDTSAPIRITISVNAVNDAPRFTKGPNQQINEDAPDPVNNTRLQTVRIWASGIARGPLSAVDEINQTLTFKVVPVQSGLIIGNLTFATPPAIDPVTGDLTYETVPDTNGVRVFRVTLEDNGNGVFPNVNTSTPETLTISVAAVNDAPSFNIAGTSQTTNEDAPLQSVLGFVSNISRGPAMPSDEDGQVLTFDVETTFAGTVTNASAAFSQLPSVSTVTGDLTYQMAPHVNGIFVVSLQLDDSGTGASSPPNNDKSPKQTFTITVNPVNDPPQFQLVDQNLATSGVVDLLIDEDAPPVSIANFATGVTRGPSDESGQVLAFDLVVRSTTRNL
ncbi:MAG: hypothetical protein HYV60_24080, partial [Planctomycetia bacterium]|nr:hypothetical protein [Planctomycetia bacterium]